RNLPAMTLDERLRHADDALCLVAVESGASDDLFELALYRGRECERIRVAREDIRRDHVHALVGALRAEDRGNGELERVVVVEFTVRRRIHRPEPALDLVRMRFQRAAAKDPGPAGW